MSEILLIGPGAVGAPLAAWLAESGRHRVRVLARPTRAAQLEANGLTVTSLVPDETIHVRVEVVTELDPARVPDLVLFATKTRALTETAEQVLATYGKDLTVVGLQNGLEVQRILASRFTRACFGILHFNAWAEGETGTRFVVQQRGPVLLTRGPFTRLEDLAEVELVFARAGIPCVVSPYGRDAALCKMVINLTGCLTALVDYPGTPSDDPALLQRVLSRLLAEGVEVLRAEGVREVRVPGTPSFLLLDALDRLPPPIVRPIFQKKLRRMPKSSLAQDLDRGVDVADTELEVILGALVELADARGLAVPTLRAVLELDRSRMAVKPFVPASIREVAARAGL